MLTILLTANTPANDFSEKYKKFISLVLKYENDFEVIFLAKNDYPDKDAFRILASQLTNHQFVVLNENNNENELLLVGLAQAQGDDILLCTWDTNFVVVEQLLQKRKDGCDLVFVKNKKSKFKKFFEALGLTAYNFGARLLKHNYDMFAETQVQLIDGRVANLICSAPDECFELRVTNNYKQLKQSVVENDKIFETQNTKKSSPLFPLGIGSFFYLIAVLAIVFLTPFFNNGIYSWWSLIVLAVLLVLGTVAIIVVSKNIYNNRVTAPVRINKNGEPILIVEEYVYFGQDTPILYDTEYIQQVEQMFEKNKEDNSDDNIDSTVSPAMLIKKSTTSTLNAKESNKKVNKTEHSAKNKSTKISTENKVTSETKNVKANKEKTAKTTKANSNTKTKVVKKSSLNKEKQKTEKPSTKTKKLQKAKQIEENTTISKKQNSKTVGTKNTKQKETNKKENTKSTKQKSNTKSAKK